MIYRFLIELFLFSVYLQVLFQFLWRIAFRENYEKLRLNPHAMLYLVAIFR